MESKGSHSFRSREPAFTITANGHGVELAVVETYNGTRLEIDASAGGRIYLDALALESLTWQDPTRLLDIAGVALPSEKKPATYEILDRRDGVTIANEYAYVTLTRVVTDAGPALELASPKLGYAIHLGPAELEAISYYDDRTFSTFLETPFG
ncbi:hypothetical protein [Haladaptatus sp. DJG-WS-42]|uniref:hypothetical protein n=1 Tax=Haladaptatus sp. DJG-WS-42 TaxID=3120516 RepID=UPI0030CF8C35